MHDYLELFRTIVTNGSRRKAVMTSKEAVSKDVKYLFEKTKENFAAELQVST